MSTATKRGCNADVITHARQIEATDEKALRAARIQDVKVAAVSIGKNIESSQLVVMQRPSSVGR